MSTEIVMPKLSDTMEDGKILHWFKRPGDSIRRGEAIAEVETDKADMVLEAFDDGVLDEIHLKEGDSAPVGAVIATMRSSGAAATVSEPDQSGDDAAQDSGATQKPVLQAVDKQDEPQPRTSRRRPRGEPKPLHQPTVLRPDFDDQEIAPEFHPAMSAHPSATPTAIPMPPSRALVREARALEPAEHPHEGGKLRASPLARRAAEEAGVDIRAVRATGPDGRITKRDIDNYLREQQMFRFRRLISPRDAEPGSRIELSRMRKTIAQRMALSKQTTPHFYVTMEVDMDEAVKFKSSLETTEIFDEDITYNDIIVKAAALALTRFPRINASYEDGFIQTHPHINIGVAVAVEDGLILPVIKECERLSLPEISRVAHRLVGKASRGGYTADEMSGATFTISNMGMLGIEHFAAVIVPPQAAILAVSSIKEHPVVRNSQITIGKTMMITVSCDHRIVDGVVAGRFLQELKRFLENPASLLV